MNAPRVRLLIVEDEEDAYFITREMLTRSTRMNFEIVWAAAYEAALEWLRADGFDVALVDYRLNGRTGLDLIRAARSTGCNTPVIMLTGMADPEFDEAALAAGAADYLLKGAIDEATLIRSIRYTLERQRAEEALRASEEKFRSVTHSAHDAIVAADADGRIISWNAGAETIFGHREEKILGQPITALLPEHCHAEYLDRIAPAAIAETISPLFELQGISESNFEFPMEMSVSSWETRAGKFVSWIVRDITHRRAAEARVAAEHNLLHTIIETIPDRIYVTDIKGRFVIDNEAHRRQVGAKQLKDVVGKTVFDFFKPAVAAHYETDDKAVIRSGRPMLDREEPSIDETGEEFWMLTAKVPLCDAHGHLVGVLGISRDITERKHAREERERNEEALGQALAELRKSHEELKATQLILIQTEKMESLGRFAAGIAHEVKNPLAQIMLAADFLDSCIASDDATLRSVLEDIRVAVVRADKIVRELLDFSAPKELSLRPQNLNDIVKQSLLLVKPELLSGKIKVVTALDEQIPPVEADTDKIVQVFINLCMNALHAMPEGGDIEVTTHLSQLADGGREEGAKFTDRLRTGDTVVVAQFCDTGHGIPREKIPMIFDPFFTTKPTGKGTGLGLTVSRKIVELHGGRLTLENRPGGGACATVVFPIRTTHAARP